MSDSAATAAQVGKPSRQKNAAPFGSACDQCYRCKVRCSGERPACERCVTNKSACTYSTGKPLGKPKGSKNKHPRKTSGTASARPNVTPARNAITVGGTPQDPATGLKRPLDEPQQISAKRPNLGQLHIFPPATPFADAGLGLQQLTPSATPSLEAPTPVSSRPLSSSTSLDVKPAHSESLISPFGQPSSGLESLLDIGTPPAIAGLFPPSELEFDDENCQWLAEAEAYLASTPAAFNGLSSSPSPRCSIHSSEAPTISDHAPLSAMTDRCRCVSADLSPSSADPTAASRTCLCDPLSLQIISDLHTIQNASPPSALDSALMLARRGLSIVSSYLSCRSCLYEAHCSSGSCPPLLLACVLILQQVFSCYVNLRVQGIRSLFAATELQNASCGYLRRSSGVSIGDFELEEEDSCNSVVDAIVRAEIERGKAVIGGLERRAEELETKGQGSAERPAGVLPVLRALRDEISEA